MKSATHREVTRLVAHRVLGPKFARYADDIAVAATIPDDVQDIVVGRFGTKVAGHVTGALTHFCVPTDDQGHMRGYNWHMDRSLCHALRRFDPRVGDVRCKVEPWVPVVGRALAMQHPLTRLIADLGGHATLDADNVTFPTAATMADWVWRTVTVLGLTPPSAKVVGCVCHWIQDCCVPHHARGWLLNGHSKAEQRMADEFDGLRDEIVSNQTEQPGRCIVVPRGIVERVAASTVATGRNAAEPAVALGRAAYWTAMFLRGTVLPLLR
jgi:hypothetical protein